MTALQKYVFRQVLTPLLAILAALTAVAILTQGLSQLDIISDQRRSGLTFLWITLLAVPQLLALILPLAVFFSVAYAVNRMHSDSELVVAYSAGMGTWQVIAPIFRLSIIAAIAQLAIALIAQPAAYREMREIIYQIRGDPAGFLVREGAFNDPLPGVTVYARSNSLDGQMRDLLINDARVGDKPVTYTAKTGAAAIVEGELALILRQGQIQRPKDGGGVDLLDFDQYVLEFGEAMRDLDPLVLKPSDRYLGQLFKPNMANYYDQDAHDRLIAEAHSRLSSPLLCPALALIAAAFLLIGDFNRRGYTKRLIMASIAALLLRVLTLGVQSAAREDPTLNLLQYLVPIIVLVGAAAVIVFFQRSAKPAPRPARFAPAPA